MKFYRLSSIISIKLSEVRPDVKNIVSAPTWIGGGFATNFAYIDFSFCLGYGGMVKTAVWLKFRSSSFGENVDVAGFNARHEDKQCWEKAQLTLGTHGGDYPWR